MSQLVGGDVPEPGDLGGVIELAADALLGESAAEVGEQELRGSPVAGGAGVVCRGSGSG